jgi:dipeptidyl aminopeptidase/acylaminoacyl peptidase
MSSRSATLLSALLLFTSCAPVLETCPPAPVPQPSAPAPAQPEPKAVDATPPAPAGPITIEGAPPIPDALKARLLQYQEARFASLDAISADGKTLLVRTRLAEVPQVHWVSQPLGARTQLTFDAEPVRGAAFLPGDDDAVLFMRDVGGAEDFQLFRLDRRTGRTTLLTDGKSRHDAWLVDKKGRFVVYSGNARNGRDMDLYVSDGKSRGSERRVLEVKGNFSPLDVSPDGKQLLALEWISILETRLHLVDLDTGAARQVSPASPAASYRAALFDATGKRAFVTSDREGEMVELYELTLGATPELVPLSRDIPWNVEGIALSPDGRTLAFSTNEDGYGVLHLLDTRTRRHRVAGNLPKAIVSGLRFASAAPVLGLTLRGPTQSADAYTYDLARKRLVRFTESELGGLDPSTFVTPELLRVKSFDGLEIPAFVYRPKTPGPHPVHIAIHGGPESQARPDFNPTAQYLAIESGIATIVPNVRGSDGYGKTYLSLDNGKKREDSVRDIGAVLDWIATQPDLDQARVAVSGGSYGGFMVLSSLTHFGKRLRGGIDVVGIANFVSFLENTRDYRRDLRRVEYGDESNPEMRAFLTQISPLSNVAKIESALFVAHGKNDPRVPFGEAQQIVEAVRKRGNEVWTFYADNEGHGFQKKANRDTYGQLAILFLERVLRNQGENAGGERVLTAE